MKPSTRYRFYGFHFPKYIHTSRFVLFFLLIMSTLIKRLLFFFKPGQFRGIRKPQTITWVEEPEILVCSVIFSKYWKCFFPTVFSKEARFIQYENKPDCILNQMHTHTVMKCVRGLHTLIMDTDFMAIFNGFSYFFLCVGKIIPHSSLIQIKKNNNWMLRMI